MDSTHSCSPARTGTTSCSGFQNGHSTVLTVALTLSLWEGQKGVRLDVFNSVWQSILFN